MAALRNQGLGAGPGGEVGFRRRLLADRETPTGSDVNDATANNASWL
jgi:hypothetical protein